MTNFSLRAPELADELHASVADLPLISPHGHVPVATLADGGLGDPAKLFVSDDHYVIRMLYSAGIPLDDLRPTQPSAESNRRVWRLFSENFALFRGTPSRFWIGQSFRNLFGIDELPSAQNADRVYDELASILASPAGSVRALLEKQNVSVLATTDDASASLDTHRKLATEAGTRILPTFRPDAAIDLAHPSWSEEIARLSAASGIGIQDYRSFLTALEARRREFKQAGGTATDHGVELPYAAPLSTTEAESLFARALRGTADQADSERFAAHMLIEMMRMSTEDGLVMQIHAGVLRDHNGEVATRFGTAVGGDIPLASDWTRGIRPLLERYGNNKELTLVLFTLDESTYARELAPLAGHYPTVRLGPPWWFHDSPAGIRRYLDSVVETAGFSNLAGFNDDTRNVATIGARHELWQRSVAGWLADQIAAGLLDESEGAEIVRDLAHDAAVHTYRLENALGQADITRRNQK